MKILLAYHSGISHRKDPYISLVPTGLLYLHACLIEAGHDSILANFSGRSPASIKKTLLAIKPAMVGISQWTHNRAASLELAATCKHLFPSCTVVMGGAHATFCYEDILIDGSAVDIIVRGEGEATLVDVADHLSSHKEWYSLEGIVYRQDDKLIVTKDRPVLNNLDDLPVPSHYLDRSIGVDVHLQAEFIVTARGCPSACYFCSSPAFWGNKVRYRSPQAIIEEILYIQQKYGLIYFSIRDDTFTADRKRVLEFCSLLAAQQVHILWNCQSRVTVIDEALVTAMKHAGCECIQLGIESGSGRLLKYLNKNITLDRVEQACAVIRKVGVNLSLYLISNIPGETDDDTRQTIELLQRTSPDDGYVSPLAYYPGTRIFTEAVAAGRIRADLFATVPHPALYVEKSGHSSAVLLKELSKNSSHDEHRFSEQKKLLGYCYTTNVLAGEWYRQQGDYFNAKEEFKEITSRQPANPWGWLLLGEVYNEGGNSKKAGKCFKKLHELVPNHASFGTDLKSP